MFQSTNISEVFNFLKLTKNQDQFSVWNMKDPNMKKNYSGIDGTKGLFIRGTVKIKTLGQVHRKLQTSAKEAGLIMNCDL